MGQPASSSRRSLAARLRAAFFAATAAAVALTGQQAFRVAHGALEEASFERLTGIRETKRRQIETYFRDTLRVVSSLARSESASNGLLAFQAAWLGLRTVSNPGARDGELLSYYRERVAPALTEAIENAPSVEATLPDSSAGRILQRRYLLGLDDLRDEFSDEYGPVHEMYNETFADYAETFGFEDLLLIEVRRRAVVYSSAKGTDLGVSLGQAAYRDSNLAEACRLAVEPDGSAAVVADFARYVGSLGAAAAFVCAPVHADGEIIGALAARLSRRKIDEVMTGGGNWRREGLGETGETYLVGADLLMRSDSRFQLEQPAAYVARLRKFGYPDSLIARVVKERTSVLLQPVDTEASRRALDGEAATSRVVDYRGVEVLSSFTPLDLPGLDWVLLSEIDVAEAFAGVAALRNRLIALGVAVSLAFAAVGYVLARRAMRPLAALTAEVERIRESGLGAPSEAISPAADDEIARLWSAFSDLTRELSETLVSRDYFGAVFESMLNAVLVVDWSAAEEDDGGPRVRFANRAARRLLNYRLEELIGRPIAEIVDDFGVFSATREGDAEAARPAVEREMIASDGRRIPVLFSAAVIRGADGAARDAVCVAQDITDWRRAQEDLRRSRGELQVLTGRLLTAREDESKRLARELHDDVTQRLGVAAIELGKLAKDTLCNNSFFTGP